MPVVILTTSDEPADIPGAHSNETNAYVRTMIGGVAAHSQAAALPACERAYDEDALERRW